MKARRLMLLSLVIIAVAALSTCTDGIFAIIEDEVKVITSTLPLTISVFDVTAPAPGGPYYIAAGGVFEGTLGAGGTMSWNPDDDKRPLNPPGTLLCNTMVYWPQTDTLWGGFISSSGAPSLYQSTSGGAYTFAGRPKESDPQIVGKQAILVRVAGPGNGHLFMVSTVNTSSYSLEFNDTGAAWAGTPLLSTSAPITGMSYDGANYWTASGNNVYTSGAEPPTSGSFLPPAVNPVGSSDKVNGIFSEPGRTFLATKKHGIYWTDDFGTSWHNVDAPTEGTFVVSFLSVAGPIAPNKYLVGSDGFGYYTLTITGSGSLSRFDDSTISLFSHSVSRILIDGVNVFMGTHMNGLWRAKFNTTTGDLASGETWVHE